MVHRDDLETTRLRLEEPLQPFRELDHAHAVGLALTNLGGGALRQGNVSAAVALDEEVFAAACTLHDDDRQQPVVR